MKPQSSHSTRREFTARSALGLLGLGTASLPALAAARTPAKSTDESPAARGIWKVIRNPKALESPPDVPAGEIWRYTLAYPFQVAPGVAAVHCNMKMCGGPGQDFEGGTDVVLFNSREELKPERAIKVTRNHVEPNPNNDNKPCIVAKYPGTLGFVPFGAKRADGTPHPHAGTGFILISGSAWPMDASEGVVTYPRSDRLGAVLGQEIIPAELPLSD